MMKPQKVNLFDEEKIIENMKITKGSHAYKAYVSNYNVETLNSFNPEQQHRSI